MRYEAEQVTRGITGLPACDSATFFVAVGSRSSGGQDQSSNQNRPSDFEELT
jgi:hypothetical protein